MMFLPFGLAFRKSQPALLFAQAFSKSLNRRDYLFRMMSSRRELRRPDPLVVFVLGCELPLLAFEEAVEVDDRVAVVEVADACLFWAAGLLGVVVCRCRS
jgi:hypothetical protein